MEKAGSSKTGDGSDKKSSSPDKDDSLKDFKSPKAESAAFGKAKVVIDKRTKKVNSKAKTSAKSKKKEPSVRQQPSIESSFFKTNNVKKEGHTCPLCMKYFEDVYAGTAHTKNCAAKNKVSTTKLLAAVALQERQTDERLALGLPAGPILKSKDKNPRRNRAATSKDDPDLQLAVALSKSLHDNKVEEEFEEAFLLAAEHRGDEPIAGMSDNQRRQTLKNFGFLTNKPVSEVPARPRRKKHLGPTVLQTRSQELRDRLLTERIAEILMGNEAITQVSQHGSMAEVNISKKRPVVLRSRLLNEIHQTTKPLWDSAKLSRDVTNFYVEDLGDAVVPVVDKQQKDTVTLTKTNPDSIADYPGISNEFTIDDNKKESETMSRSSDNQIEQSGDREESPKNVTDRQYRNCLIMDWANTLNISSMSDVVVLIGNNHIWAHKLVFHVRCSNILLDCEPLNDEKFPHVKEKICWLDFDYLAALAFLEFVYSGVIVKNEHIFSDDRTTALVRTLARKYRLKDLFEYMRKRKSAMNRHCDEFAGRNSGLRSLIIIEVPQRKPDANVVSDKPSVTVDSVEEPVITASSPECKSSIVDLTVQEKPDSDEQINENDEQIDTEAVDNISMATTYKCCTSPDLFDDTTEEVMVNTPRNTSEAIEANIQVSSGENSNLKVLAQLIAEDDVSLVAEDDGCTTSSTASTYVEDKQSEESPAVEQIEKHSVLPQVYGETPRSRNFPASVENKVNRSRSQRLPEKTKSNLSIFIDKVKKINAKSELDSYAEDESLGEPYDRGRFRNPFNVNNESNKFILDNSHEATTEGEAQPNKKGALSAFEEQLLHHEKKKNCIDLTNANERTDFNESFSIETSEFEDSSVTNKTTNTDDENTSMFSKYKKTHKHNNSISNYRSLLRKSLEASVVASENLDRSDRFASPREESIDLTQESDSEVESSPSSHIGRPIRKKSHTRPLISDSNDSLLSGEAAETKEKLSTVLNRNHSIWDDDVANKSYDNEELAISEPDTSIHENIKSNATTPRTSLNHRKNMSTSPEYPDPPQSHINEEIFTQSLINHGTLTPSPSRFDVSSKSSRRKRRIEERQANDKSFTDNSEKDKKVSPTLDNRSSIGTKSLSHSSKFPDLDVFEVDEQLFNQSFISPQISPRRSLTPSPKLNSQSSQRKRNIDEMKARNTSLTDDSDKDEEEHVAKSRRSSLNFSDPDIFDVDNHIFTQSFHSPRSSPQKALTPLQANNDDCERNGTLRVPSPISISSSPDVNEDIDKHLANTQNFNKENSFAVAESNFSPLTSERSNQEEPMSPKPGPSRRRFSPDRSKASTSCTKNSLVRWNSMPTGTSNTQGRLKRTRTPTKSSRLILSQGVTPPINYDAMDTPQLKLELEKYGIKPQKAHRARQLLTHIYNELHTEVPAAAADEVSSDDEEPPVKKIVRSNNQSSDDSESESVTSAVSVIPEEMEFADENGDFSSKSSIKQAVTALIKNDKELHNKLLTYEPLPLELLLLMLKARGFKCKVNDVMDFLDEECITFQVQDQARRRKNKGSRGKKTAVNKTRKPNSQKS